MWEIVNQENQNNHVESLIVIRFQYLFPYVILLYNFGNCTILYLMENIYLKITK